MVREDHDALVVFEATGAYHRQMETAFAACAVPFVKVNPRQARRFAEATGRLAKTDRVDAVVLAKMGAVLELEAQQPKSENLHELKELIGARRALIKDQTAARARLAMTTQSLIKRQINARLLQITEHIRGGRPLLRRAIYMPALVAVRFNPVLKEKYDQLIQVGKPAKVALTAVMRKLIVMVNALLRDGRKWTEICP